LQLITLRTHNLFQMAAIALLAILAGCAKKPDAGTAVMLIESSPTNLDPRIGTDAQSERIDKLIFDALVQRDETFNVRPWVAKSWEVPDPLTYVFHLRDDVRFHDGKPLTSADVKWTIDSILTSKVRSPKIGTYKYVDHIEAPDPLTVIFHLKEPYSSLLWNLADGGIGIVEAGSTDEVARHPVGSGPYRFDSAAPDQNVVLIRNDGYWGTKANIPRLYFNVVPDDTTRALELRKGSGDAAINSLNPDTIVTLQGDPKLAVDKAPGTTYSYLALNLRDPILKDVRVRQAMAYAMDRGPLVHYLWHDMVREAKSVLPSQHWAYNGEVPRYEHDVAKARQLLDEAGYKPGKDGVRVHITMKTSTDGNTRLLAAVLQQQLREAGIALDIRTYEFATLYADVVKGSFQMYSLRWIGGNEDPDIFDYIFGSESFPPKAANRSYYSNAKVDALVRDARYATDQEQRRKDYFQIQQQVAEELPYINLWYVDNVLVHTKRLGNIHLSPSGNYDFLKTAVIQ
jgi:peptide/nickel transport system substrate-binding protein